MAATPAHLLPEPALTPSERRVLLNTLVSIASTQVAAQLDAFGARLAAALFALADQPVQAPDGFAAFQHLSKNKATFCRLLSSCLLEGLQQEIRALAAPPKSTLERDAMDLSLVTFEAMERKVLIDNLAQALAAANADSLAALDLRIACLLDRQHGAAPNPFRPEVFVKAASEAWNRFDLNPASHRLVLREMRPEVFLQLEPILQALNQMLIAHRILPNPAPAYRLNKPVMKKAGDAARPAGRRDLPMYRKLNRWLPLSPADDIDISPALLDYLGRLQRQGPQQPAPPAQDAALLRQVRKQAPRGMLTQADENAVELLARMFDFVFSEPHIPAGIKRLIGRLQIPVLKAALADKEFFFQDDHPARRLVETVAQSGVAWDEQRGHDDPLFRMIESVVDRVEQEYNRQIALFDHAATDLESFVAQDEQAGADALSQAIDAAARQENIERARELAANSVAMRIENGEVPGFIEAFLERQWTQVLGLAYMAQDTRPEALQNALKAMDDLIWSVQHKGEAAQRKALLDRLPSLLSLLNAWLNVVKWDGPERVAFFSALAERHATIVRTSAQLTAREQLELKMNAVQKASERRLNKRAMEQPEMVDEFVHLVDRLDPGMRIEFVRAGGAKAKYRLAWVSPRRSRFVFASRQGQPPLTLTFEQLAQSFREHKAAVVAADAVLGRAMIAVLEEIDG